MGAFKYNDGGRFENESLDCTVRAYTIAAGIFYANSHAEFKAFGRKDRHRCFIALFMKECHPEILYVKPKRMQVRTFLKNNIYKTIMLRVRGHIFCVKDNVILDLCDNYRRCYVTDIWVFS